MVDISSQNNKINVTVSSSGNTANTNVTPDYAQYYSEKSKEWAISNRIVDNTDYSSKYYANESKKQADISTAKATEVIESGNNAVSNIESARDNAIIDITNQESLSVDNVNTAGITQVANVNSAGTTQINLAKEQVTLATNQANIATEQAILATNKTSEVVASGNTALSNIDTAKNNAITSITNQETTSKTSLIDEGATQIGLIQNEGATQVANVQSTGFYMRDDKLYYINSQGEETEFKSGGSGLEICDIGMALYVDEIKGLRRYLNGQIVDINTNTQAFLNRLKDITTLHPSLLCTEEEWQSAKTLSAFGQVGKFVFNYNGDNVVSVRLPRVVNVQGLFDLQNLGMTVGAGLPNITGRIEGQGDRTSFQSASGAFYKSGVISGSGAAQKPDDSCQIAVEFNASRSNSIYGNSDTVQEEAIQYPYFIQIATGSETENNIVNDIELNNPYSLFDSKYSDHKLNNLSWSKSEGQWNAKAVYTSAYDELLREYNSPDRLATFNKDAFTVVGSPTITDDGVASGFGVANYIKSNSDIAFTAGQTWEIDLKVNIKNSESGINKTQCLFQIYASNPNLNSLQAILYNNRVFWTCPTTPSEGATNRFLQFTSEFNILSYLNQDIWFKFIYDGTQYIFEWSADGINFTREVASTDSRQFTGTGTLNLGAMSIHQQGLQGSIDLNGTKITIDGVKVFSGAKSKVKLSTETYTDYDFVLNTADETFRLPLKNHTADDSIKGLTLYFYVGETVQNANLIDAGRIGEQLAGKQDKCIHIIDTYVNGTSGYRIWSDGYCEQWGLTPSLSGGATISVSLLKPYININYNITLASYGSYTAAGEANDVVHTLKTSSFIITSGYIASQQKIWKTCGYLAEGEY